MTMLIFFALNSLVFNMDLLFSYGVLYAFKHRISVLILHCLTCVPLQTNKTPWEQEHGHMVWTKRGISRSRYSSHMQT